MSSPLSNLAARIKSTMEHLFEPLRRISRALLAPATVTGPHFLDQRDVIFGRADDVEGLLRRANRTGEVTVVHGRPLMGKSTVLNEVARRLEATEYLVGRYEARGDTDDILLRALSDLYVSWLHQSSYSQQLESLIRLREGTYLEGVVGAVTSLVKASKKLLPLEELSELATDTLQGLLKAQKRLETGGLALPKLAYDQASVVRRN